MIETPETIYGRLLESVHISGYTMERACIGLEYLISDGQWKTVGSGFEKIDDFLIAMFEQKALALEATPDEV